MQVHPRRVTNTFREAEALFHRALEIKESGLGPNSLQVGVTSEELARCLRAARRPGEAVELLQRAVQIQELLEGGPDSLPVGYRLRELGRCLREAGRLDDARRALKTGSEDKGAEAGAARPGRCSIA